MSTIFNLGPSARVCACMCDEIFIRFASFYWENALTFGELDCTGEHIDPSFRAD